MRLSAKAIQGGQRTLHERPLHKQALLPRKVEMSAACAAGRHANCYCMTCACKVCGHPEPGRVISPLRK